MESSNQEPTWKIWIDRVLIFNLFLVIFGALFFLLGLILTLAGNNTLIQILQLFWKPFFIPTISLLIGASLFNGFSAWLRQQGLWSGQDK
tara:strand:- start:22 stop:291 length:270 start_codon:yes stop_codon:yes gene_type:complete